MENIAATPKTKSETRGIVDLMAIRKDHRKEVPGLKRGDFFEIVLIQTKGGTAPRPTAEDVVRLSKVAKHHRAKGVVLAEWKKADKLAVFWLKEKNWKHVAPADIFG